MAGEEERALISPCGLNCGACPLYIARTDEALRKRIAEGQGVPLEEVYTCPGCRPAKGRLPGVGTGPVCDTFACAVDDKKVEFCYECDDFPCLKLAPCADRAQEIPHNTKVYQLVLLQKEGIDTWIQKYPDRIRGYRRGKKPRPGADIEL
jgi:hypothetical protein